jgi:hypothetical protein
VGSALLEIIAGKLTMPILALTILTLMLGGALMERPADKPQPAVQEHQVQSGTLPPHTHLATLHPELSAPMFHGTVQSIDRTTLRVTIRTDFGRLVFATMENCERLFTLRPGDRVRLDVDPRGTVRTVEKTDSLLTQVPETSHAPAWPSIRCREQVTS